MIKNLIYLYFAVLIMYMKNALGNDNGLVDNTRSLSVMPHNNYPKS